MKVRDAMPEDADAIAGIRRAIVGDPFVTFTTHAPRPMEIADDIRALQARGRAYLVAECAGRVVGYGLYRQFRGGPGYARTMEHTIHLAAGARGQGIGGCLMAALQRRAQAAGVHVLVAGVGAANPAGIAFHRRLGFVEVGRMREVGQKGGRYWDLVLMQKILRHDKGLPEH